MFDVQRVKKLIDWLVFEGIAKNRRDLAKKIGYTESSLSQILNGKVSLTEKFLKNLSILHDDVNEVWLFTGDGEMLKNKQHIGDVKNSTIVGGNVNGNGNKITHYASEYDACQKEVEHLKAMIIEKDNLIAEKERLINILLKGKGE